MKFILLSSALAATALAAGDCSSSSKPVRKLQRDVTDPARFCDFWLKNPSTTNSPFTNFKPAALSKVCDCVKASPTIVTSGPTPTAGVGDVQCSSSNEAVQALEAAVSDPSTFCSFWNTAERSGKSPFAKLGDKKINKICQCAAEDPSLFGSPTTTSSGSGPTSTATSCYAQVSGFTNCQNTPAGSFGNSSTNPEANGYVAGCEDLCSTTQGCAFVFAETDSGSLKQNCHFYTAVPSGYVCQASKPDFEVTEGLKKKKSCSSTD